MENYITALNNYIAESKSVPKCSNVCNLLDILFCCYRQHNGPDTAAVRQCFRDLDTVLEVLPLEQQDQVIDITCELCTQYQKEAFREGLCVGFRLYKELQARE